MNPTFSRRLASFLLRHRALLLLVLADTVTKVAAFELLPHGRPVSVLPGLSFYLAVNDWGVMGGVHGIGAVTASPAYTIVLAIGLVLFALLVLRLGNSSLGFAWRIAIGTLAFFVVAFAAQAVQIPFAHVTMPANAIVMTIRMAALTVALAFYAVSSAPVPRVAFTLFAAGALGNAASYTYPPFEVIDFLMIPIEPVFALIGKSGEAMVGVINLADLYIFTFPLLLLAWVPAALLQRTWLLTRSQGSR